MDPLGNPLGPVDLWLVNTVLIIQCNIAKLTVNDSTLHSKFMAAHCCYDGCLHLDQAFAPFNNNTSLGVGSTLTQKCGKDDFKNYTIVVLLSSLPMKLGLSRKSYYFCIINHTAIFLFPMLKKCFLPLNQRNTAFDMTLNVICIKTILISPTNSKIRHFLSKS